MLQLLFLNAALAVPFTSYWQTVIPNQTIVLPLTAAQNVTVTWGDGFNTTVVSDLINHTFDLPGFYTISIEGVIDAWNFGLIPASKNDLLSIQSWGQFTLDPSGGYFAGCINLQNISASDQPVIPANSSMAEMFLDCFALNSPLSWNVVNVTTMWAMFKGAPLFNQLLNFTGTEFVTNMDFMFYGATNFNQPLFFDTRRVTTMRCMFDNAKAFNQPLNFNTSSVTSMTRMFSSADRFNNSLNFDTREVLDMSSMFSAALDFNQPLSFNTAKVTTMYGMFHNAPRFDQSLTFDTRSVETMAFMFQGALAFNQSLSFNTTGVTTMVGMFSNTGSFNQLLNFDTRQVTDMGYVFWNAVAFNQPLNFNTSSVYTMQSMLMGAQSFNQPLNFDTRNVMDMASMFKDCEKFNQQLTFDTTSVRFMDYMFSGKCAYNQSPNFIVTSVQSMNGMFQRDPDPIYEYTQNLGSWVTNALVCSDFCESCGLPRFQQCAVCSPVLNSSLGWQVCNCPPGDQCASPHAPTPAYPICPTCDVTVNGTGGGKTAVVSVGDPSKPVIVIIPASLFNSSNVSVHLVVIPFSAYPSSSRIPGGTSIVSIVIQDPARTNNGTTPLAESIKISIPYSPEALVCLAAVAPVCVWWDGNGWVDSGCTAAKLESATQCTCTHLTDFAVLLDHQQEDACYEAQPTGVYYPFAAIYFVVGAYCLVLIVRLMLQRKAVRAILHHSLIGFVALLRLLSCLRFISLDGEFVIFGAEAWGVGFNCAPYPCEIGLFTSFAAIWAKLPTLSLGDEAAAAAWNRVRAWFLAAIVFGTLLAIALFVFFVAHAGPEAAYAGTAGLCIIYIGLSILFHVYSGRVARMLAAGGGAGKIGPRSRITVEKKTKWGGRITSLCFIFQAIFDAVALVAKEGQAEETLPIWTGLFLTSNTIALVCILYFFHAAAQKTLRASGKARSLVRRQRCCPSALFQLTSRGPATSMGGRSSSVSSSDKSTRTKGSSVAMSTVNEIETQ